MKKFEVKFYKYLGKGNSFGFFTKGCVYKLTHKDYLLDNLDIKEGVLKGQHCIKEFNKDSWLNDYFVEMVNFDNKVYELSVKQTNFLKIHHSDIFNKISYIVKAVIEQNNYTEIQRIYINQILEK